MLHWQRPMLNASGEGLKYPYYTWSLVQYGNRRNIFLTATSDQCSAYAETDCETITHFAKQLLTQTVPWFQWASYDSIHKWGEEGKHTVYPLFPYSRTYVDLFNLLTFSFDNCPRSLAALNIIWGPYKQTKLKLKIQNFQHHYRAFAFYVNIITIVK